jgi:dTDP-4-amino-4,6-dideoxy-D-galactose acyltransferase
MTPEEHLLFEERKRQLFFYSPYNFIGTIDDQKQLERVQQDLEKCQKTVIEQAGQLFVFFWQHLAWDSTYFKLPTYKLFAVLYKPSSFQYLVQAVRQFISTQIQTAKGYYFFALPSEDTTLLQAFTSAGFRLVETRLTYYKGELDHLKTEGRYPVRQATTADIVALREVAKKARNLYDRLHADMYCLPQVADEYLATYVENALKGFADVVLVPDFVYPTAAFITANYEKQMWEAVGQKVSKIGLSAVLPICKGWHYKLMTEMTHHLAAAGAAFVYMNTQNTNRAVWHSCEKLGYRLGCSQHILVYQSYAA